MYLISNQERRDIIRLLEAFRTATEVSTSTRLANMVRIAGVLIKRLDRKPKINNSKQTTRRGTPPCH